MTVRSKARIKEEKVQKERERKKSGREPRTVEGDGGDSGIGSLGVCQ